MSWTTGVQFLAGAMMGTVIFATASRPDLGLTQPITKGVSGDPSPGVNLTIHLHSPIRLHVILTFSLSSLYSTERSKSHPLGLFQYGCNFQVEDFWVATLCSVVVGYQRFRGPC
jgi:hypothetical protein